MLSSHRGALVEQICERLGIDRTNIYKWLRFIEEELEFIIPLTKND
jgi:transposase-like protein